mgnify:CR=1 FL=1
MNTGKQPIKPIDIYAGKFDRKNLFRCQIYMTSEGKDTAIFKLVDEVGRS